MGLLGQALVVVLTLMNIPACAGSAEMSDVMFEIQNMTSFTVTCDITRFDLDPEMTFVTELRVTKGHDENATILAQINIETLTSRTFQNLPEGRNWRIDFIGNSEEDDTNVTLRIQLLITDASVGDMGSYTCTVYYWPLESNNSDVETKNVSWTEDISVTDLDLMSGNNLPRQVLSIQNTVEPSRDARPVRSSADNNFTVAVTVTSIVVTLLVIVNSCVIAWLCWWRFRNPSHSSLTPPGLPRDTGDGGGESLPRSKSKESKSGGKSSEVSSGSQSRISKSSKESNLVSSSLPTVIPKESSQ